MQKIADTAFVQGGSADGTFYSKFDHRKIIQKKS